MQKIKEKIGAIITETNCKHAISFCYYSTNYNVNIKVVNKWKIS